MKTVPTQNLLPSILLHVVARCRRMDGATRGYTTNTLTLDGVMSIIDQRYIDLFR